MALCRQLGGQRRALGLQHVKDGDLGTFLGHADDTGAADADGTPGHDGGLSGKSVHCRLPFKKGDRGAETRPDRCRCQARRFRADGSA